MRQSPTDPERLNPRQLIEFLRQFKASTGLHVDEVLVRRIISALFFAVFNYWAAKSYAKGKRGTGPNGDCLPYSMFLQEMLQAGLEYVIYPLYLYRVSADHYALNPTVVELTSKPFRGVRVEVKLSYEVVDKLLELVHDVLKYLERHV